MAAEDRNAAFGFVPMNSRPPKPRQRGLTEIRGPYYTPMGRRYLQDVLETMGHAVDSLKFAGGSFTLIPEPALCGLIELAHAHHVTVSTGGFIEYLLARDAALAPRYIAACREVGFDTIELSAGFISIDTDDWLRLIEQVQRAGLKVKPEVGVQVGAGGGSASGALVAAGVQDPELAIARARRFLDAGVEIIMLESEGITENVAPWRTDIVTRIAAALGIEHLMFEAADREVFAWYIQNYGPQVNLFVDHSQIVELEALRRGIWGTTGLWGRVVGYGEGTGS